MNGICDIEFFAMTELVLDGVTKRYGSGATAVAELDLTVQTGELMVLLGPSGCGKTTTLRLIAGLLQPDEGDIRFDGRSMLAVPPEQREAVMVFQEHALFPFMTVGENVAFGLKMRGVSQPEISSRVTAALKAVQLTGAEPRYPAQFSGGQRQRIALARALVVRPRLLLLDEPLSSLDPNLRDDLRQMIRDLQREFGLTTLFVTHGQAEAAFLADRIGVMIDGRLRQVGVSRAFYDRPADVQIARFFGATNFLQGVKRGGVVQTGLGVLEIEDGSAVADGAVVLTIRPEGIVVGGGGDSSNCVAMIVQSCSVTTPAATCVLSARGLSLQLTLPPYQTLVVGSEVPVCLPKERISVLLM